MPTRLPLFPLDVVLFPGAPLPLHIFEDRYRTLLADCLAGDERFGVLPAPGGEPPLPGAVGCIAHIRAAQRLDDGRANIVVVGESRFVLERYLNEDLPYAVGEVREFHDMPEADVAPAQLADLRRLGRACLDALQLLSDNPSDPLELSEDVEALSFQVAAALPLDGDIRRGLLASRSTGERVTTLLRLLPPLVTDLGERARLHLRARSNGKGSHKVSPDLDT